MPAEKKLAAVAAVLVIGVGAALFFRKDAPPTITSAQTIDGLVSSGSLERRLPPTGQLDTVSVQTFRIPTAAAGLNDPLPVELPPNNQALSPVGALLKPLDYVESERDEAESPQLLAGQGQDAPILHQIVDGDTLAKLADRYLGSAARSREIYERNRDVLLNPDLLPIGKVLKIPPRSVVASPTRSEPQPHDAALHPQDASPPKLVPIEHTTEPLEKKPTGPTGQEVSPVSSVPPSPTASSPTGPG